MANIPAPQRPGIWSPPRPAPRPVPTIISVVPSWMVVKT